MGQNHRLPLVAGDGDSTAQRQDDCLPRRLLQRPHPVLPLRFSAFLPAHKLAKYHDMRVDIDLHRHMNKGLRKAIAEADKAVAEQRPLLLVPLLPTAPVEVCSNK